MLTKKELLQITGGGWGLTAAITGAIALILGFIDGILKPTECSNDTK